MRRMTGAIFMATRPEALLHGINRLQEKIKGQPDLGWRERYGAQGTEEVWGHDDPRSLEGGLK